MKYDGWWCSAAYETHAISTAVASAAFLLSVLMSVLVLRHAYESKEVIVFARSCLVWFWFCGWTRLACIWWWGEAHRTVMSKFCITLNLVCERSAVFDLYTNSLQLCLIQFHKYDVVGRCSWIDRWLWSVEESRGFLWLTVSAVVSVRCHAQSSGNWSGLWIRVKFGRNELGV